MHFACFEFSLSPSCFSNSAIFAKPVWKRPSPMKASRSCHPQREDMTKPKPAASRGSSCAAKAPMGSPCWVASEPPQRQPWHPSAPHLHHGEAVFVGKQHLGASRFASPSQVEAKMMKVKAVRCGPGFFQAAEPTATQERQNRHWLHANLIVKPFNGFKWV